MTLLNPLVPIIMGSKSDLHYGQVIANSLTQFGISSEIRIASAHKVPSILLQILTDYETDPRPKVYITVAGRSNALSGIVDAQVTCPVIACPPLSDTFNGADIYSSLRMPGGVAPLVILDPEGAALAAAKIFALDNPEVNAAVRAFQKAGVDRLLQDDAELNSKSKPSAPSQPPPQDSSVNNFDL